MVGISKYNHEEERIKILKYLKTNRKELPNLTFTKIKGRFKYNDSTFYRLVFWLNGAGYVSVTKIGKINLYQITNSGILQLEKIDKTGKQVLHQY